MRFSFRVGLVAASVVAAFVVVFAMAAVAVALPVESAGGFDALLDPAAGSNVMAAPFSGSASVTAASTLLSREHEGVFGSFGGLSPQALTVDQATGDVYAVDPGGKELWRFTASGLPANFTAGPDAGTNTLTGLTFPFFPALAQVAVDGSNGLAKGDIYVTQSNQVSVFASSGEPLVTLTGTETPSKELGEACGVAVDQASGDLYVASRGSRIWRYSPSGAAVAESDYSGGIETAIEPCQVAVAGGSLYAKAWQEFPTEGAGPIEKYPTSAFATGTPLPSPSGTQVVGKAMALATDPTSGDLYADEGNKVTVLDPSGTTLYSYGAGEIGSGSAGVAVMAGGDSYVSDHVNNEIHVYGPVLEPGGRADLGVFGSFGGLSPQALTVDQATGDVYAVDPGGKELWRFSSSGAPVDFTAGPDAGTNTLTGLSLPFFPALAQVAVDDSSGPAKGDIYVTQNNQVSVFASSGEPLVTLTGTETPSKELGEACGVAVDQASGDLYVASRGSRIWRYSPSGAAVAESDYSGGIETAIEPCQVAVAGGSLYAKAWQEFPTEGAGPIDKYPTSAFVTGTPLPSPSGTQVVTKAMALATDPTSGDLYADEGSKITVFDTSGGQLYSFGTGDIGSGSAGVAVTAGGAHVYVADHTNHVIHNFGPFSAPPPLLETKPASNVKHIKATLNGHLDPNNSLPITSCTFEWGTDTNYTGTPVACEQGSSYTEPADVSAQLEGLTPGTTYHYRLRVTTSQGGFEGPDQTFETIPASSTPEVSTGKGTILSSTSTELKGTVDPNANPLTDCHFEYVTDAAFETTGFSDLSSGGSLPCSPGFGSIPADFEDHQVTATATGLDPEQIYRYRLVAENANGPGAGEAVLLPGPPLVETTGSPTRTTTTARFDSRVDPHGADANYWFEYVTDSQYQVSGFADAVSTPHEPIVVNEVQQVRMYGVEVAPGKYEGQFRLSFGGYTTPDMALRASAAEVQAALSALPSIGPGNVHVDFAALSTLSIYTITFQGALANTNVEELVASPGSPPSAFGISIATTGQGGLSDSSSFVSAPVQGLQPATTYHYRVVADSGVPGGATYGAGRTVITRASEAPLTHGQFPGPPGSDRAWEQVSIPDTNGNAVTEAWGVSSNGERSVYGIDGGTPGSTYGGETLGNSNNQFAERTASGWHRRELYPTRAQAPGNIWEGPWANPELTELYAGNRDETNSGSEGFFRMSPGEPAQLFLPEKLSNQMYVSNDGSRLVGIGLGGLDPAYPLQQREELYDFSSGTPHMIGLLPDNSVPDCVSSEYLHFGNGVPDPAEHRLTPDGSHFFFNAQTVGHTISDCNTFGVRDLYDRNLVTSKTTLISPRARFIQYAAGKAFFVTEESLIPGDHGGNDIYSYAVDSGDIRCITCSTAAAGDVEISNPGKPSGFELIAVSEDGSRIYFNASRRDLPGAAANGIYRVNVESGELAYVAPAGSVSGEVNVGNALSPDGTFFVFSSASPTLNSIDGQQNAGTVQYYLYDDRDGSLVCASCPPDGSAPRGEAEVGGYHGINNDHVANSGDFVFATPTPLVPADQNTAAPGQEAERGTDIYEWRDGRLLLVTDGKTESKNGQTPRIAGLAANGRDVFFTQPAALTPDAIDSSRRLYDARIGGGFDFPAPPAPCSLEACQGTPLPPPDDATPGSLSFSGPGNQHSIQPSSNACTGSKCAKGKSHVRKRCAKGKVLKRGKCVKKVQRKRAKRVHNNKGGAK